MKLGEERVNRKRTAIQIAAILAIIVIVAAVYIIKNGGTEGLQDSIDQNFSTAREGVIPLEVSGFTPDMIASSDKPMLLVLGEPWCQPCLRMMDDLRDLHKTIDDVEVRYIDLEGNPDAIKYFPVRVTPTIALFEAGGKPFSPPEDLAISMLLYSSRDTGEHVFTVHEGYLDRQDLDTLIEVLRDAGQRT